MAVDAFYRIGSTHSVCQDYAIAGRRGSVEFAIVSDGCSGKPMAADPGSPHTDVGARILARMAAKNFDSSIIWRANMAAELIGAPVASLDATLIVAELDTSDPSKATIMMAGDGAIVSRRRSDGSVVYTVKRYSQNAPQYLSYLLNPRNRANYFSLGQTESWECDGGRVFSATVSDDKWFDTYLTDTKEFDLTLVMSDGVDSFRDSDGQQVQAELVIDQLFAFKGGMVGSFIQRRCGSFLSRFCAEKGWTCTDDFSVAGIYYGDVP